MDVTRDQQKSLFKKELSSNNSPELLIKDTDEKQKYSLEEIRDKVIWGDAFSVLGKIEDEVFDMVFIDPPYFLQLPKKELKRWTVKTVVEGVNDEWDKFSLVSRIMKPLKIKIEPKTSPKKIREYMKLDV
ncbi:MAG: hypothetical protein B6D57_01430 [Candidatus Coatesbacteria bacterium 4484_99]|uniref:DNA methylase N-4/N-6 domain-containing protein n=1 Tax=Candidatus Coatesbacteria bacterium 4484_99 TaxID=1970774 RepID=A0A1W9S2N8_9BACT|nr:MAG: hypothetical protein B6D57_01430 [Candidatus Coatesbacteria bacterium 4484_99]RLC42255.1 MAG: hypothetical protein DRH51_01145 [Candidatus Coatesbacteria bacterium]